VGAGYPESVVDALAGIGWVVIDDFIDAPLCAALRANAASLDLAPARVGHGKGKQLQPALRGDRTRWISADTVDVHERRLLTRLDDLRNTLNRALFAGLDQVECHYAHYPTGTRYGRHLDRFRDNDKRVISCVIYLNPHWPADAGGELRIHDGDARVDILPEAARAVFFRSERFPHEVLPAKQDRYSIAAWFLRRPR